MQTPTRPIKHKQRPNHLKCVETLPTVCEQKDQQPQMEDLRQKLVSSREQVLINYEIQCPNLHANLGKMPPIMNGNDDASNAIASLLSSASEAVADVALITDASQNILYASESFVAMTGYGQADLIGQNCRFMQGLGTETSTILRIRDVLASGQVFEGEILNYRKNGSAFWTALKIIPMRLGTDNTITHHVSVQRDISNQVALLEQLQNQALHDPLTGLPNRSVAEQAVEAVVKSNLNRQVAVAVGLIDLDDFHLINNTFGHATGDAVLKQWAARVVSRLREGDVLARMGGDEFVLILKNINRHSVDEELSAILHRIHEAVRTPFVVDHQEVRVGMSLGVALVPEKGTSREEILRIADTALYLAKERKNQSTAWWEAGEFSSLDKHGVENIGVMDTHVTYGENGSPDDYHGALEADNVVVHFQPVVDISDGSVHLFEALARIRLADGRTRYPDEFLPYLDTADLNLIFTSVLDQTLKVLAEWDQIGEHHSASVNLPPAILCDGSVPALVLDLLLTHGIQPHRLGLELLESEDISLESQRTTLQELVNLGVGLALDDLGSGYSTLQRLSSFPFSAIKIDRGLFSNVENRPVETLSFMATLVQLGRDLEMNVVIEGLEDEGLTEAAVVLGAPLGQGYFFARPMPPEKCLAWSSSFKFQAHHNAIRTPLGALAYHWQFARLAAPHPTSLQLCPLTRFLKDNKQPPEVESWHGLHHTSKAIQATYSRFLTNWLAQQVRDTKSQSGSSRGG